MKTLNIHSSHPRGGAGRAGLPVVQEPATLAKMAELLDGLPPLKATASWESQDPKFKRVRVPREYQRRVARVSKAWLFCYHPSGCLRGTLWHLGHQLLDQIRTELVGKGMAERFADVEANQQQVIVDDKWRWRLSCVLTDSVAIHGTVVFCCRHGWIEIWAKEIRDQRLSIPTFPGSPQPAPALGVAVPANPG
jgi:DNA-binding transcriptional regulator/RsmH inhibitor MraZ